MFDFEFADAQTSTNTTSTGEVSDDVWDLENSASGTAIGQTDFMVEGWLNFVITALSITSGITEGFHIGMRTDDAASLATARTGSAGYHEIGGIQILKTQHIIAGREWSIPVRFENCKQFVGFWIKAGSTALVGTITFDANFIQAPHSNILAQRQKRSNTSFG
ncbi:hypothetical protein LCGC14_1780040 [marine sediment metagenome]|uniref:Uncharacterized protein n=1 Tax=marine sediment metagenome TaxID=412755 RepID=A0A0F9JAM2_9ZZZZ